MRKDVLQELEELYQQVRESELKPFMVIEHQKEGIIKIIKLGSDDYIVVFERGKGAVRQSKISVEALLLFLLEET